MLSSSDVKQRALDLGFDLCGIAPAAAFPELRFLRDWLAAGHAGTMGYMPRTVTVRSDVRRIVPSARSVVVALTLYNTDRPYSVERARPGEAVVSRYAWGDDYHGVVAGRLEALLSWMRERHDGPFDARAYVDTGPVQERVYAQYAGLGWVGKNTCLVNESLGSWVFIGEIICSLPLEPDPPALDRCGTCGLCLEACPTGALRAPRVLDATRCLSYLTIELKRSIPEALRDPLGRHVFGCDICQDVCPYNMDVPRTTDARWLPRAGLDAPGLAETWQRSDDDLAGCIEGTPMTRPPLAALRRNLAVAMGNSADPDSARALQAPPPGDTARAPLVQEHLAWARRKRGLP